MSLRKDMKAWRDFQNYHNITTIIEQPSVEELDKMSLEEELKKLD